MTLRTTKAGFDIIKEFEGCELRAYRCPAGVWTIGHGLTSAAGIGVRVVPGMTCSKPQAEAWLRTVVDKFEDQIEVMLGRAGDRLSPHAFDACVSLAYNIGPEAFRKSSVLRFIKAGNMDKAAQAFLMWNKVKGTAVPGLTRRRQAEMALFMDDVEGASTLAASLSLVSMPQDVDTPVAPKSMGTSSIGNGTIALGAGGVFSTVNEAVDQYNTALAQGKTFLGMIEGMAPWMIVAVVMVGVAWFVWTERRRKLVEEGV